MGSGRSTTSMRSAPPGGLGTAELGAVQGAQRDAAVAARQHGGLALDHGDDADACEPPFVARHEHDGAAPSLETASSTAARASAVESRDGERHAGSTTASSSGMSGRVRVRSGTEVVS